MKYSRWTKLLTGLSSQVANAARDAADMVEISENDDIESKTVIRICNEIRERLLWIERDAVSPLSKDSKP